MSNKLQIEDSLKSLILNDDREFVAMLSGEWGIGKTYFWKELSTSKELIDSKKSITYISLFGYSSIQSIKNDIVLKLSKAETTKAVFSEVFQSFRTSLGSKDGDESSNLNLSGSLVSSALSLIPEKSLIDSIICFDDFERLSDKVSFKDVMGLISQFKEQKKCKIIMILNEGELSKNHQEIFSRYKEKIVDYSFNYLPSQEECSKAITEDLEKITWCKYQTVYDFFKKIDLKNIRIMKQVLYQLNHFNFIENYGYDEKVVNEFVEIALSLFVFKSKSNCRYIGFQDMQEYISNDWARDIAREENRITDFVIDERHEINRLHYHTEDKFFSNHYYSQNKDIIEKHVYDFMDNHAIDKEELHRLLDVNNQSLSWYDVRNEISELNTRIYTDFSTQSSEIAKQLFDLLHKHKDDMHRLFHYDNYKIFITNINKLSPDISTEKLKKGIAENYIMFYIDNPNNNKTGPLEMDSLLDLIVSDCKWADTYRNEYKRKTLNVDSTEVLSIINSSLDDRWLSEDNEYKLSQVPVKDYEKLIKKNPDFIRPLVKFLKVGDSRDIRQNIIDALMSLKNENDDYAFKVSLILKSANINLEDYK